jgi:hypothetical protein
LQKETNPKQKEGKQPKLAQIDQSILQIRMSAFGWLEPPQGVQSQENSGERNNRIK